MDRMKKKRKRRASNSSYVYYEVIYADPPWRYKFSKTDSRKVENHYPTMTLERIKTFLKDRRILVATNAMLYMWATSAHLMVAFEVMRAWGFKYTGNSAVWVKPQMGMGYYFRLQHEFLLVGKRGSMRCPLPENRPRSVFESPRGRHSEKPDSVIMAIKSMYPGKRIIELFGRKRTWGTSTHGNEVPSLVEVPFTELL